MNNQSESPIEEKIEVQPIPNRLERRRQIRFFLKKLEQHEAKKPTYKSTIEDPEQQTIQMNKILAWSTSYGVLIKKLDDLGYEFKRNNERIHKQSIEYGKAFAEKNRDFSKESNGDLPQV